jgi:hypothetical protein
MTGLYIVTQVVGGMVRVWAANVRTPGLDTAADIHFALCDSRPSTAPARDHAQYNRRRDDGTTAHIRFALCDSRRLMEPARDHVTQPLFKGSRMMALRLDGAGAFI